MLLLGSTIGHVRGELVTRCELNHAQLYWILHANTWLFCRQQRGLPMKRWYIRTIESHDAQ